MTNGRKLGLDWPRFALALTLMLSLVSCQAVEAEKPDADNGQADGPVAVIGDEEIAQADLEEAVGAQLARLQGEFDRQKQQILEGGLEELIADKLLQLEAAKRGLTNEALLEAEVNSKVKEITDEEVSGFYEAQRAQMPGPMEQMAPQIKAYLAQQQQRQIGGEFLGRLRQEYGVRTLLEPLRVEIETAGHPAKGKEDALVTIVEFSDFQCPYCSRFGPTLDQVVENYGDKVRIVFRQFPLGSHPQAWKAAEASLCASEQGKFWQLHDAMFADQRNLALEQIKEMAAGLDLDGEAFAACLDSDKYAAQVQADLDAGSAAGVTGTPAVFINGRFLNGAQPYEALAQVIDSELERLEK